MVLCTDGVRAAALFLLLGLLCHKNELYMKQRYHVNRECESICNLVCLQGWIMWPQPERRPTLTILRGSVPHKWLVLCFLFSSLIDILLEHAVYSSTRGTPGTVITVQYVTTSTPLNESLSLEIMSTKKELNEMNLMISKLYAFISITEWKDNLDD